VRRLQSTADRYDIYVSLELTSGGRATADEAADLSGVPLQRDDQRPQVGALARSLSRCRLF
jgi:hypothetical protein